MIASVSIYRPDPMAPDTCVIQDNRGCLEKVCHKIMSILREIGFLFITIYRRCLPASYTYDRPEEWNSETKALCVLIHGLYDWPCTWNPQLEQLNNQEKIDTFVPSVTAEGNCSLEEAADPILPTILDYAKKNPGKPICLMGASNGSRIATYLETQMRTKAPTTPIRVSTIAGIHFGSSTMNHLNGPAKCFLKPEPREEFSYGSEKAKELLKRVREPLADGVAERAYEFYASPDDAIIPDLDSSLPFLGKGEIYHIVPGQGHCSLFGAVAEEQIATCIKWIDAHQ